MPFAGKFPMTQNYGVKVKYMRSGIHNGIDWGMPKGTPLIACFDGEVIVVEKWLLTGYGRNFKIKRKDGLIAHYAHCSEIFVDIGTKVKTGEMLARSGNSGYVISLGGGGYHLHFGTMQNGSWFNPNQVLDGMSLPLILPEIPKPKPAEPVKIPVANKDENIYTVQRGDTLSKLAKIYLGDGNRWIELYNYNKETINNPNKLKIGQLIKIPNAKKK